MPSLAGEYKQVTVLCGGLADALALAGRLGPEAMHRHMQTVFTVVQQVLHRYAGSLIEFSGEGFVALFGAPVAQEDHAQRAVLAGLALHAQVVPGGEQGDPLEAGHGPGEGEVGEEVIQPAQVGARLDHAGGQKRLDLSG